MCKSSGPPDVLELQQVEKPFPGDHEVLIKAAAEKQVVTRAPILRVGVDSRPAGRLATK